METKRDRREYCMCALDGIIDLIGKKWVLLAINAIATKENARFKDIYTNLNGISPSTLSWILRQLEAKQIISRATFPEIPPRTEYTLTGSGKELRNAIIPLLKWASERDWYDEKSKNCDQSKYVRVILK